MFHSLFLGVQRKILLIRLKTLSFTNHSHISLEVPHISSPSEGTSCFHVCCDLGNSAGGSHLLVGGFLPFEKYAREIGNLPQIGVKINKCLKPPPSLEFKTPLNSKDLREYYG